MRRPLLDSPPPARVRIHLRSPVIAEAAAVEAAVEARPDRRVARASAEV